MGHSVFSHSGDDFEDRDAAIAKLRQQGWDARATSINGVKAIRVEDRGGERISSYDAEHADGNASNCGLVHYGDDGQPDDGCLLALLPLAGAGLGSLLYGVAQLM